MYKHGASCVLDMFDGNTSIWIDIDINVVGFFYISKLKKHTFEQIVFEMEEAVAIVCSSPSTARLQTEYVYFHENICFAAATK